MPDITLTYGDKTVELKKAARYHGIEINCSAETVKRMSNGANLYEIIDTNSADFFELQLGQCEIFFSMPGIGEYPKSVTMIVQFAASLKG